MTISAHQFQASDDVLTFSEFSNVARQTKMPHTNVFKLPMTLTTGSKVSHEQGTGTTLRSG